MARTLEHHASASRRSRPRRWAALTLLAASLVAAACVGCTPDFEDPQVLKDLRVLAMRADPPEVLVPIGPILTVPRVSVAALVVDPRKDKDTELTWWVNVCSADQTDCRDAAVKRELVARRRSKLLDIAFEVQLDPKFILDAIAADRFRGFGGVPVYVELHVEDPDGPEVVAIKRLAYGFIDPPSKVANKNPVLRSIAADSTEISQLLAVKPGQKVVLLPALADGSKENYVVRTFDGSEQKLDEFVSFHFFTDTGDLSHQRTGGRPSPFVENKKVDDVTSEWVVPPAAEVTRREGNLYIVVRDDRGGVTWRVQPYRIE